MKKTNNDLIEAMTNRRHDGLRIWNVGIRLWILAFVLSCLTSGTLVRAQPEPGPFYSDNYNVEQENLMMLQKIKQLVQREREIDGEVRELAEKVMAVEGILDAKSATGLEIPQFSQFARGLSKDIVTEDDIEQLPIPSPLHRERWDKRGSYMALCHFKICNMGRKRQL